MNASSGLLLCMQEGVEKSFQESQLAVKVAEGEVMVENARASARLPLFRPKLPPFFLVTPPASPEVKKGQS